MRRNQVVVPMLILALCLSASVNSYPQLSPSPGPSTRSDSAISALGNGRWRVTLSAKDAWYDTAIFVEKGTTVNLVASGSATWAPPGGRDMSGTVGPNGTRPPFPSDRDRFPVPYAGCGALVMKIGAETYLVGEKNSIKSTESGTIRLMVNDDVLADNKGGFFVEIEIPQSPAGNGSGQIVFSSQRDGNQEIYRLDLSTGVSADLSLSSYDDGYPRCSPDGRTIAFATDREGAWEVYLMNRDGNEQRNLTRNRGGNGYMDWSPDGRSLVFASTRIGGKNNEIYTVRADGTGLRRLTNNPAEDVHPVWSPDGKKIAFASERDGNRQIYVMNSDGTNAVRLMSNRWYDDYPAWSPDGTRIAFASDRDSRASDRLDIYVAKSDGSVVTRVVSHPADDRHPAWSPDGGRLAFASNRDGDRDIFIVRTDGTGLRKIASSAGNDEHPHWCGGGVLPSVQTPAPGTVRRNSMGMEFVWVPPGEFMMGSSEADIDEAIVPCRKYHRDCKREYFADETPKHKVSIVEGFWMGRYEVTQGEWELVMGDNPSSKDRCRSRCPVNRVSWDDIQVFLGRLNARDREFEYSLPSEAEWEYAARAGTTTAFAFGMSLGTGQANFANLSGTTAVGSYRPNAWGLYDMHGNVWEWVQDIYNKKGYSGLPVDGSANVAIGDENLRVLRGGSWVAPGYAARSAERTPRESWEDNSGVIGVYGFRVVARLR